MSTAEITYAAAIREALQQEMQRDERVVLFGLDVDDPLGIVGSTLDLHKEFGPERVFGTPLSEDAMTGVAIGMAMAGLRPVHVHIRMDFMMLAMNQLVNMAAKAHYKYGEQISIPMVIKGTIGKSWGQGAQHSQSLYSLFAHIPGLKVVAPTNPYDAKGCLVSAIRDNNPVVFVEHRLLYPMKDDVPEYLYEVPPGDARVVRHGTDVTLVGISYMCSECRLAADVLDDQADISCEVIDPVWLSPLDMDTIRESVCKTGHLLVVDNDWTMCGIGSEIIARLHETGISFTSSRMGFHPSPCPPSPPLEQAFYPSVSGIVKTAYRLVTGRDLSVSLSDIHDDFRGPF